MNTVLCREEIEWAIRHISQLNDLCEDFTQHDDRFGLISVELRYVKRRLKSALEDAIEHIYVKAGSD